MKDLLISESTKSLLEQFLDKPAHALLITGLPGIGKQALAEHICGILFEKKSQYNQSVAIYCPETEEKYGVETVDKLQKFFKIERGKNQKINKIAIFSDSNKLSVEGQNKLLKILEEPPIGSMIMLTAPSRNSVLPTIASRCQSLQITKPDLEDIIQFYTVQGFDGEEISRAYKISGGLPGLMHAILNRQNHKLLESTDIAKKIISSSLFDRLVIGDDLAKDRELMIGVVFMMQQIASVAITEDKANKMKRWRKIFEESYYAEEQLNSNASSKIICDKLLLSI